MPTAVQVAGLDPEGGGTIHVAKSCSGARGWTHPRLLWGATGPAHRAGIQPNDLLVAADDQLETWRFLEGKKLI